VSLEGKERKGLKKEKKKEGVSERNIGHRKEGLWMTYFSSKYETLLV